MKFSFEITVGKTKFTIQEDAENHLDFVKKASFFTSLPTHGPNGEDDLELRARKTKKGYYYSIVSPSAKKEFKLGVSQQEPGTLFPKGWDDLYASNFSEADEVEEVEEKKAAQTPAPTAPAPASKPAGLGSLPKSAATKTAAPKQNEPSNQNKTTQPAANPAVSSVLAKYGIQKNQ